MIKLLEGTQGIGVVLAHTQKTAEAFMGLNADILVQEYSKEAGGADIRSLVVDVRWWVVKSWAQLGDHVNKGALLASIADSYGTERN